MSKSIRIAHKLAKATTGIEGLDEITGGGLPRGRTTLVLGGPGSGKTILALQTLVNGATRWREPGIFVAFEESSRRILANAATFGWNLPVLERRQLFFLDAQPSLDLVQAGSFDLQGLLASLAAKVDAMKARRVVFDSVDMLVGLLAEPAAEQRELHRLHEWLLERDLTALVTAKVHAPAVPAQPAFDQLQFMVDCAVRLNHDTVSGVSQRSLRVLKFRGSGFSENESPLLIGPNGIEVAGLRGLEGAAAVSHERVASGVRRLDAMLGGGYYRGACVLITGSPGTAKTTLGGAFAEAACARGERTLLVSFDSEPAEIVRNLASVRVRLDRFVRNGRLHVHSARTSVSSAEVHLLNIRALARAHRVRNLVIDPVSALGKTGNEDTAHSVVERLIDWAKARGITVVCTSLLAREQPESEGTPLQISTIADTWIHLSYVVNAGERNRALTIIKSRGTAHSNQVRELVLHDRGVTLTDVYRADGQVLMGTLRWQQEQAERTEQERLETDLQRKRRELKLAQAELNSQAARLRQELSLKEAELALLRQTESRRQSDQQRRREEMSRLRQGDSARIRRGQARASAPKAP